MKYFFNIMLATASLCFVANAQTAKNVLDIKHSITDSDIIYPETYEINTQKRLESWYLKNYTASDDRYKSQGDVQTSDATIRERLANMNTVIEMPFNQIVRSYIDRYTQKSRGSVSAFLGLSLYYMPIFEQALEEHGLPLELKYLPIIESGLNPNAVSKSGATGLWQFMLATGKGLDMEISSLVDERRDPYKSSQKAAEYLKTLYDTYGDWSLAIAAYNCGPGTVNKAIRRAGGDPSSHDYWSIYYYLPAETRGYVPMFIAANYVMNYYPYHNISPVLATKPLVTDTLMISDRVHFEQISNVLDIPIDELRVLNPQFRNDLIPGRPDKKYSLVLPSQQIYAYIMSEDAIHNYNADKYAQRTDVEPGNQPDQDQVDGVAVVEETFAVEEQPVAQVSEPRPDTTPAPAPAPKKTNSNGATTTVTHKVEPGETLATIAQKYHVSVQDIKSWNNMTRNAVRTGQMLRITTTPELAKANGASTVTQPAKPAQNTQTAQNNKPAQKPAQNAQPAQNNKPAAQNNKQTAQNNKQTAQNNPNKKTNNTADTKKANSKNNNSKETDGKNKNANGKNTKAKEPAQPSNHTVKAGENLSTIAKKYGTTAAELQKANGLKGDKILPGDNLKLPKKPNAKKDNDKKDNGKNSKNTNTKTNNKKK